MSDSGTPKRCGWVGDDPLYLHYHDTEWGVPEYDDRALFEKLVLDVEMLQQMMEFLTPVDLGDDELAFDAMQRVPTGGHFFGDEHTLARYETAFYEPLVSDWQNNGAWLESGGLTATQRATRLWQVALEDYQEPAMDPAIREALDDYVARRKEQIRAADA